MTAIFDILAIPLGWLMRVIYNLIPEYMLAIFLFTLLVRIVLFPLSLKTQKSTADRARLAPRLERLKKKYEKDPKKLQEKQMALYEKHGVSMTGGCMPMLVQMLVLFGIISVIYAPLKHIAGVPDQVITASVTAMTSTSEGDGKLAEAEFKGYYKEMRMLNNLDKYETDVKASIMKAGYDEKQTEAYIAEMKEIKKDFMFFGKNLLENPWSGFANISILWLIPLISGLTAFFSSLLSMHYTKMATAAENQQAQGCSNVMMLVWMPAFSLFITFTVPGGVGIYWICSNLIALLQTYVLNQIYNPAKIRAQAEIEYEERRRQKQEDKKRLAEARAKEQRELALQQKEEQKNPSKKKKATPAKAEEPEAEEKSAEQSEPKDE
ncbi:MAG: membrane protein insertase YidC [Clostridia bacterium]|nr:membrane protein insertase YidC [Clostridia bacterium]